METLNTIILLLKIFTFLDNSKISFLCILRVLSRLWGSAKTEKHQSLTKLIPSNVQLRWHFSFTVATRPPDGKILSGLGKSFGIPRSWRVMVSYSFTLSVEKCINLAIVEQCSQFEYGGQNWIEIFLPWCWLQHSIPCKPGISQVSFWRPLINCFLLLSVEMCLGEKNGQ